MDGCPPARRGKHLLKTGAASVGCCRKRGKNDSRSFRGCRPRNSNTATRWLGWPKTVFVDAGHQSVQKGESAAKEGYDLLARNVGLLRARKLVQQRPSLSTEARKVVWGEAGALTLLPNRHYLVRCIFCRFLSGAPAYQLLQHGVDALAERDKSGGYGTPGNCRPVKGCSRLVQKLRRRAAIAGP